MPKITCITTTYNEGHLLLNAVHSVLNQSFADFEYIIVDDGSAEETREILAGLKDPRLKIILQENAGLSAARNVGIALATGDYVCFLDADDLRPNWSFAAIAKAIDATNPDVVLCPGFLRDLRDQIEDFYDARIFRQIAEMLPEGITSRDRAQHLQVCSLAQQMEPQSSNKVLRRDFLQSTGLRFPAPFFFEDIFFHTMAIAKAERIAFLDIPTFTYFHRYQKPQITATTGVLRFDIIAVVKQTLDCFALLPEFDDLTYRTVVLASCLKLITWCEVSLAHPLRRDFQKQVQAMIDVMNPVFRRIRLDNFLDPAFAAPLRRYMEVSGEACDMVEEKEGSVHISPPPTNSGFPALAQVNENCDDLIRLRAFGQEVVVQAPKVEFLRSDSIWRLHQVYQPALATQTLAPEGTALDIGAGFGAFSVPFALAYPGWRVFCFEPDPVAYAFLQKNISALGLKKVTALPFAIGCQKDDAPLDPSAVRDALGQLSSAAGDSIERLGHLLPLVKYSKSTINNGYLERGINPSSEFMSVKLPTLAAAMLEILSPRLLKIIAPKVESDILSDLAHEKIDHIIGESWGHVTSTAVYGPSLGRRDTWMRRAGTDRLALRKAFQTAGRSDRLDIVLAPRQASDLDLASIDAILSDPSDNIGLLAILDDATEPFEVALQSFFGDDPRLRVLRIPNHSQGRGWNFGRLHSTASHISFVDGRSMPESGFFSGLLDLARQTGAEVVQGPYYLMDGDGLAQSEEGSEIQNSTRSSLIHLDFPENSYHFRSPDGLILEPPSISRRVYRRDFLESRKIWFPDHVKTSSEFFFQAMTLRHLPDIPELDGPRFGQSMHHVLAKDHAFSLLESFGILLQRAVDDGWNDFALVALAFAAQINLLAKQLNSRDRKKLQYHARKLWARRQNDLPPVAMDSVALNTLPLMDFSS